MALPRKPNYLDILRLVATYGVILLHFCARPWENMGPEQPQWLFFHLLDSAVRWAVPVFVMISGALFLNPAKEISFTLILRKYILRVVTAFAFWSAIYTLIEWGRGTPLSQLPLTFIKGEYHMWFLFLIIGLYLFVPLLRRITRTKKGTQWFLAVGGVLFFVLPRTVHLLSLLGVEVPFQGLILQAMNVNVVSVCYLFVFVLGHYLEQYALPVATRVIIYVLGLLGFGATVGLTLWHSFILDAPSGAFYVYMSLNVMAMAVAVFVAAQYGFRGQSRVITAYSSYSFGAYLSHVLFVDLFARIGITPVTVLPGSIITFILAMALSALLHYVPVIKKYIV